MTKDMKADIGLIGLAVMGENLARNLVDHGFRVAVYDRFPEVVNDFCTRCCGKNIIGTASPAQLVQTLARPRKILLMIKAGQPVDDVLETLIPLLEAGDIVIDGGNSQYRDTERRVAYMEEKGLLFVGTGVSGGEQGARYGCSVMPGGSSAARQDVMPVLRAVSAKAAGEDCCVWMGHGGAGHFVKMVHNGIEYGDIQLIAESYDILRRILRMSAPEIGDIFATWNDSELSGYLIGITADILRYPDVDGAPLVDKILDRAGQKGTGKWAAAEALEENVPLTLIAESVFARCLSADRDLRQVAKDRFRWEIPAFTREPGAVIEDLRQALYAAKIVSYAQGFALLSQAKETYGWETDLSDVAAIWRGGCIIRSAFLDDIRSAYRNEPGLRNLLLSDCFSEILSQRHTALRRVCALAVSYGIPVPAFSAALAYFDGFRTENLPHNLLQAQRDYFGAHTYERIDREGIFHTDWTGHGGKTVSTQYSN